MTRSRAFAVPPTHDKEDTMALGLNDVDVDGMQGARQEDPRESGARQAHGEGALDLAARDQGAGRDRRAGDRRAAAVTPPTRRFFVTHGRPAGALGGVDAAPTAAESLVAALAGCLTSGIAANAALFDVPIDAIDDRDGSGHRLPRTARPRQVRAERLQRHPLHRDHPEPGARGEGPPVQGDDRSEVAGRGHARERRSNITSTLRASSRAERAGRCRARSTASSRRG